MLKYIFDKEIGWYWAEIISLELVFHFAPTKIEDLEYYK